VFLDNSSASGVKSFSGKKPILCYVTDRKSLPGSSGSDWLTSILEKIETLATAGIDWIQIREKDLPGRVMAGLVREGLTRVSKVQNGGSVPSSLIVNDRLDIALAERAAGAHLGENSLPIAEAKRLPVAEQTAQQIGPNFLIGASCHSLSAAQAAAASGADYIFFGPIFATPSKAAYGAPQGLDRLEEVCNAVAIPVLAIGGITLENATSCFSAGAAGIAAIRLFQDARDPRNLVDQIRSAQQ
jgi:thiamine-phosphate pyrophosphorylase